MSAQPAFEPINMDRSKVVVIRQGDQPWLSAPQAPIERFPLEREAPEHGQVTSLVRYLPGARFPQHTHPLGEEIYVLEGVFSDESGDYPAGSYLRNPPGSAHAPFSEQGCLIFVKLNQFAETDTETVRIRPEDQQWRPGIGGLTVCPLHEHLGASTALVRWPAGEVFQPHRHWGAAGTLRRRASEPVPCWRPDVRAAGIRSGRQYPVASADLRGGCARFQCRFQQTD